MCRNGALEVDVSVSISAVQCAADVSVEVQVEGLHLMVEVLQIFHEGG